MAKFMISTVANPASDIPRFVATGIYAAVLESPQLDVRNGIDDSATFDPSHLLEDDDDRSVIESLEGRWERLKNGVKDGAVINEGLLYRHDEARSDDTR
jgi:hypothetical protein